MAANTAKIQDAVELPTETSVSTAKAIDAFEKEAANGEIASTVSPARDLQARLEAEIIDDQKVSARSVTAMVLIVCLSTWGAGILLYASL